MKYLEELQRKKLFCLSDMEKLTGNRNTAKYILQAYRKAGYITKIRRNLYAALDLATKTIQANRYEIGSCINKGAYVSYHSALEYHGISNQLFHTMTISSLERFSSFEFDGVAYTAVSPKIESGVFCPPTMPLVRVTDMERTIVDCIYDLGRAGGIEELLEAFQLIPQVDEEKLIQYLEEYHQIYLWQKTGFLLSLFQEELSVSDEFLKACKEHINRRKKYLLTDEDQVYYSEWELFAPENLKKITGEGENEIV